MDTSIDGWHVLGPEYMERFALSLLPWDETALDAAGALCLPAPFGAPVCFLRAPLIGTTDASAASRLRLVKASSGRSRDVRVYDTAGRSLAKYDYTETETSNVIAAGWVACPDLATHASDMASDEIGDGTATSDSTATNPPAVLVAVHIDGRVSVRDPAGRVVAKLAFSFGETAKRERVVAACVYYNRGGLTSASRADPGAPVTGGVFAVTAQGTVLLVDDLHRPLPTRIGTIEIPAEWSGLIGGVDHDVSSTNPFGGIDETGSTSSENFTVLALAAVPPVQTSHGRAELHISVAPAGDAPDMPSRCMYLACDQRGGCVDQQLPERFGCIVRIAVSPGGNLLALANAEGSVHVATSDLRSYVSESDVSHAGPQPVPDLVLWCGSDAVALAWHGACGGGEEAPDVVLVGPAGDHVSINVGSSFGPRCYGIAGVTEVDGMRLLCGNEHVFVRRVPASLRKCLEPGSAAPGALLLDAVRQLDAPASGGGGAVAAAASLEAAAAASRAESGLASEGNGSDDDVLRGGAHIAPASAQCIEAAAASLDAALQRRLLRAATFGAAMCGRRPAASLDTSSVVEAARAAAAAASGTGVDAAAAAQAAAAAARDPCAALPRGAVCDACDAIWVLNAVRSGGGGSGAAAPRLCPTHAQLIAMGPDALCLLLCYLDMHAEAAAGCHVLRARRGTLRQVLVNWSRRVLETSQGEADEAVLQKLLGCLSASSLARVAQPFVGAAAACREHGRPALAASLLKLVPRCRDRVPLLLATGSSKAALDEALKFGDGLLVASCLAELRRKAERDVKLVEFFGLLASRPVARRILAASLRAAVELGGSMTASSAASASSSSPSSMDAFAEAESARELLNSLYLHAGDHAGAAEDAWKDGMLSSIAAKKAVSAASRKELATVSARRFTNAKRLSLEAPSGGGGGVFPGDGETSPDHLLEQATASSTPLDAKDAGWRASMCEVQARLLTVQAEMEVNAVGLSVLDTIKLLFATGNAKQAAKLKSDFSVSDRAFSWTRLRGLASSGDWAGVEKFARENPRKPGGIGHDAFLEVCFEWNAPREALIPHIKRHPNGASRSAAFAKAGMLREAAEEAAKAKDVGALAKLRDVAPPHLRASLEGLLSTIEGLSGGGSSSS